MTFLLAALMLGCADVRAQGDPPPTRATIRGDGTLILDEKPVFPIGIFAATIEGENCARIADLGFNCVATGGDAQDLFFEAARDAGLFILAPHYNWATFAGRDEAMDFDAHEDAGLKLAFQYGDQVGRKPLENLKRWDDRPGVFGWYLFEEPKAVYAEALEFMYEIFKSHSPAHIMVGVSAEKVWYHLFSNALDVLMVDVFPYRPGDRVQPELLTYDSVRHGVDVLRGKPVWLLAQGGCMWKTWDDFPPLTLANFRNQAHLALAAGAKGYFIYSFPTVSHFGRLEEAAQEAQWAKIRTVVGELKTLAPILCDGRPTQSVRLAWKFPGGKGVPPPTRVLEYYGNCYLIVANIGREAARAQVLGTNYGLPDAFDARVFSGSEGLRVEGRHLGAAMETVNQAQWDKFPTIVVEPDSSGVFELTRRPARPPAPGASGG